MNRHFVKYALAGLAVLAAVAALFFRPPHIGSAVQSTQTTQFANPAAELPTAAAPNRQAGASRASLSSQVIVYVAGEVRKPGVYALRSDARGVDALARAGGPLADADLVAVNLAARVNDGDEIAVPKVGAISVRTRSPHARATRRPRARGHARRGRAATPAAMPQSIDLNTAGANELQAIPGVGPALAQRIIAYRAANGPFGSVDELGDVAGITPRLQDALAQSVFVH